MSEIPALQSQKLIERLQESDNYGTESVVMFGSAVTNGLWMNGSSDIDLNVFVGDQWDGRVVELANSVALSVDKIPDITWQEHPRVVVDDLQPRVEAVVSLDEQVFDISWATRTIQINRAESKVRRDNLEVYLGQIY